MSRILLTLIVFDAAALAYTLALGLGLDDAVSIRDHLLAGMLASFLIIFTHVLVIFYLIGTGMDIREAVEEDEELSKKFIPLTRRLKKQVFPWACFSILLIIVASLLGAEVHSRMIPGPGGEAEASMPLRQVGGWWVHPLSKVGSDDASLGAQPSECLNQPGHAQFGPVWHAG